MSVDHLPLPAGGGGSVAAGTGAVDASAPFPVPSSHGDGCPDDRSPCERSGDGTVQAKGEHGDDDCESQQSGNHEHDQHERGAEQFGPSPSAASHGSDGSAVGSDGAS